MKKYFLALLAFLAFSGNSFSLNKNLSGGYLRTVSKTPSKEDIQEIGQALLGEIYLYQWETNFPSRFDSYEIPLFVSSQVVVTEDINEKNGKIISTNLIYRKTTDIIYTLFPFGEIYRVVSWGKLGPVLFGEITNFRPNNDRGSIKSASCFRYESLTNLKSKMLFSKVNLSTAPSKETQILASNFALTKVESQKNRDFIEVLRADDKEALEKYGKP